MSEQNQPVRPKLLVVGLIIALLEAAALIGFGVAEVIASLVDDGALLGVNAGILLILVLIGAFIIVATRALWQGKRWGRGPVITWQLLQFAVALTSWGSAPRWLLVVAMALSAIVVVGLLAPRSLAATGTPGSPSGMM